MKRVWLLNLDAELELAKVGSYETPKRIREQITREAERVQSSLCLDDEVFSLEDGAHGISHALRRGSEPKVLVAWCPTPNALRLGQRAGLVVPKAPTIEVLRRVNHRAFALDVAQSAAGTGLVAKLSGPFAASEVFEAHRSMVVDEDALHAAIAAIGASSLWPLGARLKRAFGFAGKGQRHVALPLRDDDLRWIGDALRAGAVLVEPQVDLRGELSIHGYVDERDVLVGAPCVLSCDRFGAPIGVRRAELSEVAPTLADTLVEGAGLLAGFLRVAGYFGPFGLDVRLFDSPSGPGVTLFGDVNARFTLGFGAGLGDRREDALARLVARGTNG